MISIESQIKDQYKKYFVQKDWYKFKNMAEYYLETAVHLKKKDINPSYSLKLLIRNVQKRLFIGIGCELLLKSFYLKNGYCINRVIDRRRHMRNFPFLLKGIDWTKFKEDDTHTMNDLIDHIHRIKTFTHKKEIIKGFKIAKVFRNKEGHIIVWWHKFVDSNYTDIETALKYFYEEAFNEEININFSIAENEKGIFEIK